MIKFWILSGILAALIDVGMNVKSIDELIENSNDFMIRFLVRTVAGVAALVFVILKWRKELLVMANKIFADL